MAEERMKAVAFCGATASGKSAAALQLARYFNLEIICMDSMQIYRGMDIGTAKPTPEDRLAVPHHMLDIVEPDEAYTVSDYVRDAQRVIAEVRQRGKLPLLIGGTGLYLKALMHGFQLGYADADPEMRARLHQLAETEEGRRLLLERLFSVDPISAERLHPNDVRRVIRAIEVYEKTGIPFSISSTQNKEGTVDLLPICISWPRDMLYERIEKRVDDMLAQGLEAEARELYQRVPEGAQSLQAIGYKEWKPYFDGACTLSEVQLAIKLHTRHYAKRQLTFQRGEDTTLWLKHDGNPVQKAADAIRNFIKGESIS